VLRTTVDVVPTPVLVLVGAVLGIFSGGRAVDSRPFKEGALAQFLAQSK
jgi:hypothetical protein